MSPQSVKSFLLCLNLIGSSTFLPFLCGLVNKSQLNCKWIKKQKKNMASSQVVFAAIPLWVFAKSTSEFGPTSEFTTLRRFVWISVKSNNLDSAQVSLSASGSRVDRNTTLTTVFTRCSWANVVISFLYDHVFHTSVEPRSILACEQPSLPRMLSDPNMILLPSNSE